MTRLVAFGEIMLRLSPPGRELLMQTPRLDVWIAGAEANVVTALATLGQDVAIASALPPGPLGDAALFTLRGRGIDCSQIKRLPGRMGLYYVTSGAGQRPTEVIYDRAHSAFAEAPLGTWDWDEILSGAGRLHLSGITPALGPNGTQAALFASEAAERLGVPISFDGNYRARLWEAWAGEPRLTLAKLVERCDLLFGNHRDISLLLDQDFSGDGPERRREAAMAAFKAFPRLQTIASTARRVEHVGQHRISARIDTPDEEFETAEALVAEIVDRVGTGDAFAAGILHGLQTCIGYQATAEQALALAILKHSQPGDSANFDQAMIDGVITGGFDIRR